MIGRYQPLTQRGRPVGDASVLSGLSQSDSLQPHGLLARQALLSMGFSRQEYWSGLPCPLPGDLPNPGIEARSPTLQVILYQLSYQGSPNFPLSSLQFSCSVVSDSLRPHESQHARPPCPSPTPRVHSDSHPLSQ